MIGLKSMSEGLRAQNKREMRERISDAATALFLESGFDVVRVADVAAAARVAEKTVYNYFPTKESLMLENEERMTEALVAQMESATGTSPIDVVTNVIVGEIDTLFSRWGSADKNDRRIARFVEVLNASPALGAAQREMFDRLTTVTTALLASRVGSTPDDPEAHIAAIALIGLWTVANNSLRIQLSLRSAAGPARAAVISDTLRAASLLQSGLASFMAKNNPSP
jgi:AcrR family transcriptional regulator